VIFWLAFQLLPAADGYGSGGGHVLGAEPALVFNFGVEKTREHLVSQSLIGHENDPLFYHRDDVVSRVHKISAQASSVTLHEGFTS
jgi:hypothetical protein